MNTNGRISVAVGILLVLLVFGGVPLWAQSGAPAALRVSAAVDPAGVRLQAVASGPFEYSTYRASDTLFIVEMSGVALEGSGAPRVLNSEVVSSYRLLPYRSGGHAVVRLEVLLRHPVGPRIERGNANELTVAFDGTGGAGSAPARARLVPAATSAPVASANSGAFRHAGEPSGARITRVALDRDGGQVRVHVEASSKLNYQVLRLNHPDRVVLDFSGALVGRLQKLGEILDPITGIRAAQFRQDMARVVIDLSRTLPYSVSAEGSVLTIAFGASAATLATPPAANRPAERQVADPPVRQTAAVESQAGDVKQASSMDSPAKTPMFSPPTVAVDSAALALPNSLSDPAAAAARPKPADTPPAPASVAVVTTPEPAATIPTATPVSQEVAAARGPKKYSGEPISVNLKDVDLKDFFRLIHEISGLNIVLDPAVRGTLTLVLDDVPWDQALDIVLQNNGLDKQLDGNVLRIATRDTLKKEAEQQRDLSKAQNEAVPQITATRTLSYAKASALRDTLKRFLSARGDILADDRSNILIIRDIPSVLPDLDALIKQLDRKSQQVEIEARVVSASRTFSREIGVQFGVSAATPSGRNVFGGLPGTASFVSPIVRGPALPPPPLVSSGSTAMPLVSNLPATAPTSGFSYAFSSANIAVDLIISAAEARGVGKLLSKPKIVTQNNQQAIVKQGTKIPVQTEINNTITTEFIDAVLRLTVTPQITADGTIYMDVDVENTQIDNGIVRVMGIPALDTQEAQTKVLVSDGGTVVIGGVIISSQQTSVQQVPLLGSIPVLGYLFRHTTISSSSQELYFFLTPRIIPS
jgi:type IV pilus assembly protein PilQ